MRTWPSKTTSCPATAQPRGTWLHPCTLKINRLVPPNGSFLHHLKGFGLVAAVSARSCTYTWHGVTVAASQQDIPPLRAWRLLSVPACVQEDGVLILEGLLNIYWGLRRPIRLQMHDDNERFRFKRYGETQLGPSWTGFDLRSSFSWVPLKYFLPNGLWLVKKIKNQGWLRRQMCSEWVFKPFIEYSGISFDLNCLSNKQKCTEIKDTKKGWLASLSKFCEEKLIDSLIHLHHHAKMDRNA